MTRRDFALIWFMASTLGCLAAVSWLLKESGAHDAWILLNAIAWGFISQSAVIALRGK